MDMDSLRSSFDKNDLEFDNPLMNVSSDSADNEATRPRPFFRNERSTPLLTAWSIDRSSQPTAVLLRQLHIQQYIFNS